MKALKSRLFLGNVQGPMRFMNNKAGENFWLCEIVGAPKEWGKHRVIVLPKNGRNNGKSRQES